MKKLCICLLLAALLLGACAQPHTDEVAAQVTAAQDAQAAVPAMPKAAEKPPSPPILSMDTLCALCAQTDAWNEGIHEEGLGFFARYANMERQPYNEHSVTQGCRFQLSHGERAYTLYVSYYPPESTEAYGFRENAVDGVYLTEEATGDARLLYSGDGRYAVDLGLPAFLSQSYDIKEHLSFTLPEGVSLGAYRAELVHTFQGCLFEGDFAPPLHADSAPEAWYAPGGLGVCPDLSLYGGGEGSPPLFLFEDGMLVHVAYDGNHMGLVVPEGRAVENGDFSAILFEYEFELFTPPEMEEYKQSTGKTLTYEESCARFYYAFFADEGDNKGYTAFFNQAYFTEDDVRAFMRGVTKAA